MAVIRFVFSFPWGMLAASSLVAIATGFAVIGFGAPPAILVPVGWSSAMAYRILSSRFEKRLNQR